MSVSICVPKGYKLVTEVSPKYPNNIGWVFLDRKPTNRVWWKFWLPRYLYQYSYLVEINDS